MRFNGKARILKQQISESAKDQTDKSGASPDDEIFVSDPNTMDPAQLDAVSQYSMQQI